MAVNQSSSTRSSSPSTSKVFCVTLLPGERLLRLRMALPASRSWVVSWPITQFPRRSAPPGD
eukprot:5798993-Prorocentrum_lima.AAC.1